MALSLIREAQAKSTLSADDLQLLEVVKKVLGKESIVDVMESFTPTNKDFAKWLDVIQGYAKDSDLNINKKNEFFDVAGAVLEDDPLNPPYSMHEAIMKKLWLDYKAMGHMRKIAKVAQAAEDEERVASAARAMVYGDEDEEFEDQLDGTSDESALADSEVRDERPASDTDDEDAWWHDDEDDTDDAAFPKFADREFGDRSSEDSFGEMDLDGAEPHDDMPPMDPEEDTFDPGVEGDMAAQSFPDDDKLEFENEEDGTEAAAVAITPSKPARKPMSVLQQMLTLPKTSINALVKDVESEGAAAWKQHSLPQNPHPKGSMAHKAWERGMINAMKNHAGVVKEPTTPVKKKKK